MGSCGFTIRAGDADKFQLLRWVAIEQMLPGHKLYHATTITQGTLLTPLLLGCLGRDQSCNGTGCDRSPKLATIHSRSGHANK